MPCARGCCETQADHYRSLHVADPNRKTLRKVTTHRDSRMAVDVTERWEGQDVTVKPGTTRVNADDIGPGVADAMRERRNRNKEQRR